MLKQCSRVGNNLRGFLMHARITYKLVYHRQCGKNVQAVSACGKNVVETSVVEVHGDHEIVTTGRKNIIPAVDNHAIPQTTITMNTGTTTAMCLHSISLSFISSGFSLSNTISSANSMHHSTQLVYAL